MLGFLCAQARAQRTVTTLLLLAAVALVSAMLAETFVSLPGLDRPVPSTSVLPVAAAAVSMMGLLLDWGDAVVLSPRPAVAVRGIPALVSFVLLVGTALLLGSASGTPGLLAAACLAWAILVIAVVVLGPRWWWCVIPPLAYGQLAVVEDSWSWLHEPLIGFAAAGLAWAGYVAAGSRRGTGGGST